MCISHGDSLQSGDPSQSEVCLPPESGSDNCGINWPGMLPLQVNPVGQCIYGVEGWNDFLDVCPDDSPGAAPVILWRHALTLGWPCVVHPEVAGICFIVDHQEGSRLKSGKMSRRRPVSH